jgi:hypothetical protein
MGDTFSLLLRPGGDVTVVGKLNGAKPLGKVTKVFAKFGIAAAVHSDRSASVTFGGTGTAISPAIPGGKSPTRLSPSGSTGL